MYLVLRIEKFILLQTNNSGLQIVTMSLNVTSGSDPHGTCNVDSDGCPKRSRTSGDYREQGGNRGGDLSQC